MPCFVCSSPSAPGAAASRRAPGAGGHWSGALVPASNRGGGVTTGARELGCSVGPKAEIFPPSPKKFPFPRWVFKLCKYLEKRYLLLLLVWCHCFREGGEGGAGPFQQRPQEPHTPFYKKYTNILLTFLHRFFFSPPPSSSKNNPVILFFFFLCTACSQSRTRNYLQAMYRGRVSSSASPPTSACPGGSFWPPQRRAWKEKQGLRARQSPPPA